MTTSPAAWIGNGSSGSIAQRLSRGLSGRVAPETLNHLTSPDRLAALAGMDGVSATAEPRALALLATVTAPGETILPQPHRGRRGLRLLLGGAGVALALLAGTGVAAAPGAQAAVTPAKGPGLTLKAEGHAVHVGPYKYGTRLLYCTDWGLQVGNGDVRKGTGTPKLDAETRARINTIVNTYGQTTDNRQAARVKLAIDTLIAPRDARLRKALPGMLAQMTPADRLAISNPKTNTGMVEQSATHAPYKVTKTLTGAIPGQQGQALVTVLGSNGKPATGLPVTFALTGATIPGGTVKTGSKGQATLPFTGAGVGQSMTATLTAPSATAVWQNTPSKGHQLMVGGGITDTVRVSDVADLCPVTMTVSTHCDCDHDGMRQVDVTFTAADLPGAYRVAVLADGVVRADQPLKSGETITVNLTLPKRTDVTGRWSIPGTTYSELVEP